MSFAIVRPALFLHLLVLAVAALSAVPAAAQQPWPNRPIKMILQSPPGGTSDIIARLIQGPIQETLGQTMVIESRTGSFGIPAGIAVSKSPADGYTIALFGSSHAANVTLQKTLPYDTLKDFVPIALAAKTPNMIAANPATQIHSIADLVAAAKAKPGSISYGTTGLGLTQHFSGESLRLRAGIDIVHVPYRGAGPAIVAAIGGEIPIAITVAGGMAQHIQSGRLRAIAVTGTERLPQFPNVPTVAEQGFPDFSIIEWFVIVGPSGIPPEIVRRLNAEINRAMALPAASDRLRALGFQLAHSSPDEVRVFIESEIRNLRTIIQAANIKAE